MIDGLLIFSLLITGNVLLTNGFGALGLQRNKNNFWFTLINSACMVLIIVACSSIYDFVYSILLDPYNLEKLGVLIIVLLAGIFNFVAMETIKLANKEMYYYYDTTYSFVINLGLTIGVLFCLDPMLTALDTLLQSLFVALGYVIVSLLFAFVYNRLHNNRISRIVRPVPITILTMAVLAMIIYAIVVSI